MRRMRPLLARIQHRVLGADKIHRINALANLTPESILKLIDSTELNIRGNFRRVHTTIDQYWSQCLMYNHAVRAKYCGHHYVWTLNRGYFVGFSRKIIFNKR